MEKHRIKETVYANGNQSFEIQWYYDGLFSSKWCSYDDDGDRDDDYTFSKIEQAREKLRQMRGSKAVETIYHY